MSPKETREKFSRREMLRLASLGALGAVAASCAPPAAPVPEPETIVETVVKEVVVKETVVVEGEVQEVERVVTATPPPLMGKITFVPGGYMPSEDMEWSETNPNPHDMLYTLLDEYKELHPDVEIELIQPPPQEGFAREFVVTSMAADTIPDTLYQLTRDLVEEVPKGWWVNLDAYLQMSNPYVPEGEPGSEKWIELFYDIPFESNKILGSHYSINYDIVTSMLYYNKDIFSEVGIDGVPETLSELLDIFEKLEAAGYVAYGGIGSWFMYESLGQLGGSIMAPLNEEVNPDGGAASYEEVACAIERGVYRYDSPLGREWLRLMKEVGKHRTPDWSDQEANAITKWLNGEIVIVEDGTWRIKQNKLNPLIEFEWGMFYPPYCDTGVSDLCTNTPCPPIGGAPGGWCISKGARRDDNIDLCVDWVMFLCAPQNAERLINDYGQTLPMEKGAMPEDPDLQQVLLYLQDHPGEAGMWTYYDKTDFESRWEVVDIKNAYILDQISIDEAAVQSDEVMVAYAVDFIESNEINCEELGFPAEE
jgi:ABC-type glycerol-3-phosphate transport system substrate-binding protein